MKANEQYAEFEGLAVSLAGKCFTKWRESLSRRGVELEDAVAEAQLALVKLAPRLEDPRYVQQQRIAFVSKSLRGHLNNWAAKAARNGDARDLPDPPADGDGADAGEMLDLREALAKLDGTMRAIVLARHGGQTYREISQEYGLTESAVRRIVKAAEATLKRLMHA